MSSPRVYGVVICCVLVFVLVMAKDVQIDHTSSGDQFLQPGDTMKIKECKTTLWTDCSKTEVLAGLTACVQSKDTPAEVKCDATWQKNRQQQYNDLDQKLGDRDALIALGVAKRQETKFFWFMISLECTAGVVHAYCANAFHNSISTASMILFTAIAVATAACS